MNDDRFDLSQFGDGTGVTVARRLQPGRSAAVLVVLVLVSMLVNLLVTNERFEWDVVAEYFTSTAIVQGLLRTLQLTALAMAVGIVLGVILAVMRTSRSPLLSTVSGSYIWFFRAHPCWSSSSSGSTSRPFSLSYRWGCPTATSSSCSTPTS